MSNKFYIEVYKSNKRWPLKRPQQWRWRARSRANGNILAVSSEGYTNAQDMDKALVALFGYDYTSKHL